MLLSLLPHRSGEPTILGRYSATFALLLGCLLFSFLAFGALIIKRRHCLHRFFFSLLAVPARVPGLLGFLVVFGATSVGWALVSGGLLHPLVVGGLMTIFIGLGLLLHSSIKQTRVKKYYKLFATLSGIVLCLALILAVEVTLRVIGCPSPTYYREYPRKYSERYDFGVSKPLSGRHRSFSKRIKTGEYLYDVIYTVDEKGRRVTSVTNRQQRNRFILFFGGSFTYGEGIRDNQTLPYAVGRIAPHYMPYNYGFIGHGPFDALAKLENIDLKNEVREDSGLLIYYFATFHISRVIGSMNTMSSKYDDPFYRKNNRGEFVRAGSFFTGRPLQTFIFRVLLYSKILEAFKINFPLRINDQHIQLTAECFEQIQKEFKRQYPQGRFYVLIYPGSIRILPSVMRYFEEKGIRYLDYSKLFSTKDPQYYLAEEDRHPSALANQKLAEAIVRDLRLQ